MSKIIIIGGGASGLISAIYAAKKNNEVIILEKNNNCGKKLLITGNGKCNYWNQDQDLKHFNSENFELLERIFTENNKLEIQELFDKIGIIPRIKNGYYYPMSNQSISILNSLLSEINELNIEIIYNSNVIDVKKNDNNFIVKTDNYEYSCDKVILSTGSKAHPKTGSDGFGYKLLEKMNHQLVEPFPSLVQLISDNKITKEWAGVRNESSVSLIINEELVKKEIGELMLTDYGVSGICIFNLSYLAVKHLKNNDTVKLSINFLESLNLNNINKALDWFDKRNESKTISEILDNLLNYKLGNALLKESKVNKDDYWNELSFDKKETLINNLINFPLNITSSKTFDEAQVCGGGLSLNEININTMESKIVDNLFITGELLDICGDCGGYNLTNAFITGMIAGKSAGND